MGNTGVESRHGMDNPGVTYSPQLIAHLRRTPVQVSRCEAMLMKAGGFYRQHGCEGEPSSYFRSGSTLMPQCI
jgi:hypothetical protein